MTPARSRTLIATLACGAVMLVGAAAGDAASPPAVTEPATAVTSMSAALNGVVNPGGLQTFWEFQWGTTSAYGNNTTPSGPITGNTDNAVMAPLTGLQPNTTYHFRLVVVQGAGGVSGSPTLTGGSDETFTTKSTGSGGGGGGSGSPNGSSGKSKKGHASLKSHTLHVKGGHAVVTWKCSGAAGAKCKGGFSIRAHAKGKSVHCGGGAFSASAGGHDSVHVAISGSCAALLHAASHHRLHATLKAAFSAGTGPGKVGVTLVG
jgi:hypothetical protein